MRDDQVYRMHEANARRDLLLLRQFEFLQTKIQAYEEVLSTSWARVKFIFAPEHTQRLIDNRQKELLAERDQKFKEVQEKSAATSRIIKVGANGHG